MARLGQFLCVGRQVLARLISHLFILHPSSFILHPFALCLLPFAFILPFEAAPAPRQADMPFEILEPLVVQDFGFEKTFLTFARERIKLIAGRSGVRGSNSIGTVLGMIFEADQWRKRALFKTDHPDLIALYGGEGLISAEQFLAPANLAKLRGLMQTKPKALRAAVDDLDRRVQAFEDLEQQLAIVPPAASASGGVVELRSEGAWLSPAAVARMGGGASPSDAAIASAYVALRKAYLGRDREGFAQAAERLVEANHSAARQLGVSMGRLKVDLINTRLEFFKWSAILYLVASILYVAIVSVRAVRLGRLGWILLVFGFATHALGLAFRSILVGRAPMANMYESLVFAVAGMVALAIVLDRIHRNPLIGLGGALLGFIFMVIANKMPVSQSRVNPLVPALQSSWLTYHVTTIMLSYSAFALSFLVSCLYLLKRAVVRRPTSRSDLSDGSDLSDLSDRSDLALLDFYTYRIIAVGFPLLTVGIFTGAVWAATAWGRPWAFDPKETWSAITWLVYALFLHTRFLAGWRGGRSAALAVVGFASVLFTYLGVNYLLPGLHSYA